MGVDVWRERGVNLIRSRRDIVLIAVAGIVILGAVVVVIARGGGGGANPDFPDGHPFICEDCGHVMILSDDELFALRKAARESPDLEVQRIPCSACGSKNTVEAVKCPACGKYFARPGGRPVCPHCQTPFPSPFEDD